MLLRRQRRPGLIGAAKLGALGSSAPPPWTPAVLSQLWLWLTAGPTWCFSDAGGSVPCANGDAIYVWKDRSGNAHDVSQPTSGQRPTLVLSGGLWRARFNPSASQYMSRSSITTWPTSTGFVSSRFGIVATGSHLCSIDMVSEAEGSEYYRFAADGNAYAANFRASRYGPVFAVTDSVSVRTYTQTSDSDYRVYNGGSQVGTTQSTSWSAPTAFFLGVTGSGFSDIDIAGVVAGASVLGTNRTQLETYLATLL